MAEECVYDYHDSGYRCERKGKKRSCPTIGILKRMTLPLGGRFWGADRKDHFHTSPSRRWVAKKSFLICCNSGVGNVIFSEKGNRWFHMRLKEKTRFNPGIAYFRVANPARQMPQ